MYIVMILFYIFLIFFIREWINHTCILVSKMGLTNLLAQLIFILRAKLLNVVMKCKMLCFLCFKPFFSKCTSWSCDFFSHVVLIQSIQFFCENEYTYIRFMFCWSIFLLSNSCYDSIGTIVKETNSFITIMQLINPN